MVISSGEFSRGRDGARDPGDSPQLAPRGSRRALEANGKASASARSGRGPGVGFEGVSYGSPTQFKGPEGFRDTIQRCGKFGGCLHGGVTTGDSERIPRVSRLILLPELCAGPWYGRLDA